MAPSPKAVKSIWKFVVPVDGQWHEIELPSMHQIVHVDNQKSANEIVFWAEVRLPEDGRITRRFQVFGTGQDIPLGVGYVGTCLYGQGSLVWHLYEDTFWSKGE